MATLNHITPAYYIKKHAPAVEPLKDVSLWFKDEKLELNFGESEGRPNKDILLHKEYLTRFLENGWTVDAVLSSSEGGNWVQVSAQESEDSKSGNASSEKKESQIQSSYQRYTNGQTTINGTAGSSIGISSSTFGETNLAIDSGTDETTSDRATSKTTNTAEGAAYWYAYQRIRLKRRRMQPEKVLQTMVTSFTNEYNSGRAIDDARYNELISLYSVMLFSTEGEANALVSKAMNLNPLVDRVVESIQSSLSAAQSKAISMGSDVEQSTIDDINRQFDAVKSEQMANMISNGMFNNTIWASVEAGIERQRAAALAKARSESSQISVTAQTSVAQVQGSVWAAVLDAKQKMSDALDKRRITATEVRNTVLKWMLDYAGSREEVYPTLEEVSMIAQQLGFSVGAAGNVL